MIETTRAIVDLSAIVTAAADARLTTLVAGTNDLAKELRCRPGSDRVFSPSEEEVSWSAKVVEAFADSANERSGALRIDGQMVERLHLEGARRMLAIASATSP